MNVNSGKRTKSGRDMAVSKFSFFLFFTIPTEPVSWLVVLRSFRNTKQSPLHILRAFWSGQRGQERLWETGICLQKTWALLSKPKSPKTLGTRNIVTNSSFTDFVSFAAIFKNCTKHQLYMIINNNIFSNLLSPQKYFIELHRNVMAGAPNDNRYSEFLY